MVNKEDRGSSNLHWAWIILGVCFVDLFINYGIRLGYGIALPEMIRTIGFNRTQGGDIFNAYFLAYICFSPFTGYLTDRFGARVVISAFGILLGGGTILMGTVDQFWEGLVFFAIVGIGGAAMWTPVITLVQRWFAVNRRGMALGILSTGFGLGYASMGRIFPVIVEKWSWQYCWYMLGVAALVMVVINAVFLRSKPEDVNLRPWGEDGEPAKPAAATGQTAKASYRQVILTKQFWVIGFSYFCISGALYIITTFLVDYARTELAFPYAKASLLATTHGLGQIVGVLTMPLISDRIGRRVTITISNICIALSIAGIMAAGQQEVPLLVSVGCLGAFFGATFPMYGASAGDYFRKEMMGSVIGALTAFYGVGAIVAHRVGGHLKDSLGSFSIPFSIAIGSAVLAGVLMYSVGKRSDAG